MSRSNEQTPKNTSREMVRQPFLILLLHIRRIRLTRIMGDPVSINPTYSIVGVMSSTSGRGCLTRRILKEYTMYIHTLLTLLE